VVLLGVVAGCPTSHPWFESSIDAADGLKSVMMCNEHIGTARCRALMYNYGSQAAETEVSG
jgi:hypothetical protein